MVGGHSTTRLVLLATALAALLVAATGPAAAVPTGDDVLTSGLFEEVGNAIEGIYEAWTITLGLL